MIYELRNKDLRIIELFIRALKVFKDNFFPILVIILIGVLPFDILYIFLLSNNNQSYPTDFLNIFITWLISILQLPASMAVAVIVEQNVILENFHYITVWEKAFLALKKAFSRYGSLLFTGTFMSMTVFFLSLLFIIPAVIFLVHRYFLLEAVTLRNYNREDALLYSKSVVQGRWWKIFLLSLIIIINSYFLVYIFQVFFGTLILINPSLRIMFQIILHTVFSFIVAFNQSVSTICFLNLEYQKN